MPRRRQRPLDPTGRLRDRLRSVGARTRYRDGVAMAEGRKVPIGGGRSWHPHGRYIRVPLTTGGSVAVHAVTIGSGPDLVLIHGFVQASWAWRHNLLDLSQHFTVHAICLPGSGWSEKPRHLRYGLAEQARHLLAWLDCMAIDRAHMVGNSLGGALALQLATLAPDRVDRLCLINPAGAGSYPMAWLARMQRPAWQPVLLLPGIPFGLKLGLKFAAYAQLPIDDTYMAHFLAPLSTPGAAVAALHVAQQYNADLAALERRLGGILHRTLVIRGGADRVMPSRIVNRLARGLHDATVECFEQSGHCPMEEEPGRFNPRLLAFLQD